MQRLPQTVGPRPRALLVVRNPFEHDARVLRAAGTLDALGCEVTVLAGRGAPDAPRSEQREGFRVARIGASSRLARRLYGRASGLLRSPAAGNGSRPAARPVPDAPPAARSRRPVRRISGAAPARAVLGRLVRWATAIDFYVRGIAFARRLHPALVHCNDYNTMWIGVAARVLLGSAVVYDSHELWPDRNMRPEARWWLLLCEALFVRVASGVVMTSPAHAEVMGRRYRVATPVVVRNIPERAASGVSPRQATASRKGGHPVAVYVGGLLRNRGIEQSIRALARVERVRLRLLGPVSPAYRAELERLAADLAVGERVEFAPPVPPTEVVGALAGADVGLALFEPVCLSHRLVLPNKLFEYAHAGLPVIGSDLPMIARFVHEHGLGRTVDPDDVEAIAAALAEVVEPGRNSAFRAAASRAREKLDWSSESEVLTAVYRKALAEDRR